MSVCVGVCVRDDCVCACFLAVSFQVLGQLTSSKHGSPQQQGFQPATDWFANTAGAQLILSIHSRGMLCRAVYGAAANLAGWNALGAYHPGLPWGSALSWAYYGLQRYLGLLWGPHCVVSLGLPWGSGLSWAQPRGYHWVKLGGLQNFWI